MRRTRTRRTTSRRTSRSVSWSLSSGRRRAARSGIRRFRNGRSLSCRSGLMHELKTFLQFLRLNRNASAHTVRAYDSDLTQFLAHTAAAAGVKRADLAPASLDRQAIRGFLAELHKQGQSRATAARKLA